MKLLDPRQSTIFVPACDKDLPEDQQAKFHIKALTVSDEGKIHEAKWVPFVNEDGERSARPSASLMWRAAIDVGLNSVSGPVFEGVSAIPRDKQEDKFGIKRIDESFISRIPGDIRTELAMFIMDTLEPTESDRKN